MLYYHCKVNAFIHSVQTFAKNFQLLFARLPAMYKKRTDNHSVDVYTMVVLFLYLAYSQ